MKDMIKNSLILFVITLVAGFALGSVYDITKAPRAKQEKLATDRAYKEVFADASKFDEKKVNTKEMNKFIADKGVKTSQAEIETVVEAKDNSGEVLGYVFTVVSKEGYGGDIKFTMGVDNDGKLGGISILSINETAGLGMQANTDGFKKQFKGKQVESITYSKTGATKDNEIDAISGATITTSTMTNGVNAGLYCFKYLAGGKADE